MARYNYLQAVKEDVKSYIEENEIKAYSSNREDIELQLNEDLWVEDSVTGNGSGSYTFNAWQAEENICHNLDLLAEALEAFGGSTGEALERGAEYCDVTIRCYLLAQAIAEILDEIEEEEEEEEDNEE